MLFFRKTQRFVALIMLFTSLYVIYNNISNSHSHRIFGHFLIHSHPFSKNQDTNPIKRHQHSANSLLLISLLNKLFFIIIFSAILHTISLKRSISEYFTQQITKDIQNLQYSFHLRAPPK
jgi:hypothetical protein